MTLSINNRSCMSCADHVITNDVAVSISDSSANKRAMAEPFFMSNSLEYTRQGYYGKMIIMSYLN